MGKRVTLEFDDEQTAHAFKLALVTNRACVVPADGHSRTWTVKAEIVPERGVHNVITGDNVGGIQCGTVYGGIVQDGVRRPHP